MRMLKDFSEIQEAAKLFDDLVSQSAVVAPQAPAQARSSRPAMMGRPSIDTIPRQAPVSRRAPTQSASYHHPEPDGSDDSQYRGDRLENTLYTMCKRGNFQGAVLADGDGLTLAVYNSPVEEDALAAFTTVLGDALEKAGKLLEQYDANNLSMDINYTDKVVLRRFLINDLPYYMMTICPQEVDERAEVELSVDQLTTILSRR